MYVHPRPARKAGTIILPVRPDESLGEPMLEALDRGARRSPFRSVGADATSTSYLAAASSRAGLRRSPMARPESAATDGDTVGHEVEVFLDHLAEAVAAAVLAEEREDAMKPSTPNNRATPAPRRCAP